MQDIPELITWGVRRYWKADQGFNPRHVCLRRIILLDGDYHAIGL